MKHVAVELMLLALLCTPPLQAEDSAIPWWSLGSGASLSSAGNTTVTSSVGHALVGSTTGGNVQILGGFLAHTSAGGPVSGVRRDPFPLVLSLSQNYPNPFNPSTTIEYSLPHAGPVTLKVYGVLGDEIATLVAGPHSAGTFKATWDASRRASGVYFCRLIAGDYVQIRKMVVMK